MKIVKCMKCGKKYQLKDHENLHDFQCDCGSGFARQSKAINKSKPRKMESQTRPSKSIKKSKTRKMEFQGKKGDKKKINFFTCPYCGHKIGTKAKSCYNCRREIKLDAAPEELRKPKKSEDVIIAIFATLNVSLILYFLFGNLAYIFGIFMIIIFISLYTEGKWKFKNTNKSS
jgi:DNA-directed RNA polymerase subunit RPC12/RpoP